jgi:sporulation protein YlmC with PRC-barrel domain
MSSSSRKLIRRDELMGKDVYDFNARRVGTVTDIAFSEDAKPVLVLAKPDKTEEMMPLEMVDRFGDVVLLKANSAQAPATPAVPTVSSTGGATSNGRICVKCGTLNPLTTRFCTQCRNQFY